MSFTTLRYSAAEGLGRITLARPALYNRFDLAAHEEFERALVEAHRDPSLRALVIDAEGRHFSAGGDLSEVDRLRVDAARRQRMFHDARHLVHLLTSLEVPVVVAVQGEAAGLGASIAVLCDIVIVTRTSGLTDPHVAIGLAAGDGGCVGWPLAMGLTRAKRYLLTGDRLDGERAYQFGLATDLVDTPDDLPAATEALARRLCALAPQAVRGTKRALASYSQAVMGSAFELAWAAEAQTMVSDDAREAVQAFRDKRPPVFTGR